MELFHECKNKYFRIIEKVLNRAEKGISKEEILGIIKAEEYSEILIGKDFKSFSGMLLNEYENCENFNVLRLDGDKFYPRLNMKGANNNPLLSFTEVEKRWLKMLLKDRLAKALIGSEISCKLEGKLKDIHMLGEDEILERTYTFRWESYTNEQLEDIYNKFHRINKVITDKKKLIYTNVDRLGNVYKDKVSVPIRIEYSIKDERLRVSMYIEEEDRTIMVNLHTMSDIRIIDGDCGGKEISKGKLLEKIKEDKYSKEPIILQVTDKRAAMERCFMAFSGTERTSRIIGEGVYEIKLNYYVFQEEELIRKILALGPFVRVTSPKRIVDNIVERIQKSMY